MTPDAFDDRLRAAVLALLAEVPDDVAAECMALVELDDESRGVRLAFEPPGSWRLTWVGRHVGTIDHEWLTGQDTP